jgi:hypothetical protein
MTTSKKTMNAVLAPAIGLALVGGLAALPPMAVATEATESTVLAAEKAKVRVGLIDGPMQVGVAFAVDVNPTLKGKKAYRVVLKGKHKGDWVRCQVKFTEQYTKKYMDDFKLKGRTPHEVTWFLPVKPEFKKPNKKACAKAKQYKVVVPAQHGLQRGVALVPSE